MTGSPYVDSGLANGTTYYYAVSAVNGGGESANSVETNAAPIAPPGVPLVAAAPGNGRVTVSWNVIMNASSYNVKGGTSSGSYTWTTNVAGSPYVDNSVANGTTYYYVVSAVNGGGEGANSSEVSAMPASPPVFDANSGLAGAQDGSGTWDMVTSNWWIGINVPWNTASNAVFGAGVDGPVDQYAINVPANINSATIFFNNSGYVLSSTASSAVTISPGAGGQPRIALAAGTTNSIGNKVIIDANTTTIVGQASAIASGALNIESGGKLNQGNTNSSLTLAGIGTTINVQTNGTVAAARGLWIGNYAGDNVTVNILGGTVSANYGNVSGAYYLGIGSSGAGTMGIVNLESGFIIVGQNPICVGIIGTTGILNLDGGTNTAKGINTGGGTSIVNFNGSTCKAIGGNAAYITNLTGAYIRNGGATIDDGGFAITIGQALLHSTNVLDDAIDGGLTKLGTGTLTLMGTNTYTGPTITSAGTLALDGNGSVNNSALISLASGATLDVSAFNSYALSTNSTLISSGGNLTGSSGGTVSLGAQPILLACDGSTPSLTVTQASTLMLNANAITVSNAAGTAFGLGTNHLIQVSGGNISGPAPVLYGNIGGAGLAAATYATIQVNSNTVDLVVSALNAPSLSATPSNGVVTLSWNAVAGASSYNIKRGTSSGSYNWSTNVTGSPYVDTSVMNGTTYYYVVSAVNGGSESVNSVEVSAMPASSAVFDANLGLAGAQDGSGTWDMMSSNWWGGTNLPWSGGNAIFGAGTDGAVDTYAVNVPANLTVSNLTFLNTGYILSGGTAVTISNLASFIPSLYVASGETASIGTNVTIFCANGPFYFGWPAGSATSVNTDVPAGTLNIRNGGKLRMVSNSSFVLDGSGAVYDVYTGGTIAHENGSGKIQLGANTNAGATTTLNIFGGTVGSAGPMWVGNNGNGTLNVKNGTVTLTNTALLLGNGAAGVAAINLDGGMLTLGSVTNGAGSGTFNFNGGTLKAYANKPNFISRLTGAYVRNGGAIIDDGGFAITISQALLHSTNVADNTADGGLTKLGTGTLTLTGTNTYTGPTIISAGTLALGGTGSVNNSALISLANGATLDVSVISSYVLGNTATLSSSGGNLTGSSGGTVSLGAQPINLAYNGTAPALTVMQASTLTLNANAITVSNATGTAFGVGTNHLIQVGTGASGLSGTAPVLNGKVTGLGVAPGTWARIQTNGGYVDLAVATLAAPANLNATPSNALVTLSWSSVSNATSYNVKRGTSSGVYTWSNNVFTTACTNTGLVNGTTYYYVVSAVNSGGESTNSAQVSARPVAPPAIPTGLMATSGTNQLTLSWFASAGAASYNVKRSLTNGGSYTLIFTTGTTNYLDAAVTTGMTYFYVVSAVNAGGESGNSSQASGMPLGLPNPWQTADIGAVGIPGSVTYTNPVFTVKGSGVDIQHTADQFRFVYQTGDTNCSIVARVTSVSTNASVWSKVGVMIRETLNTNSTYVASLLTASQGLVCQSRTSTAGSTSSVQTNGLAAPYWVKVARAGNTFIGYRSTNGTNWIAMSTNTVTMGNSVYIGLVVSAVNNAALCTGTFDNVTAQP